MRISSECPNELKLTNDGELSFYFIGTGAAFTKTLNQNNILIVKGDDHLLIDCGTRCSQSLHDAGLPLSDINNYVITHSHADHIGGLEEAQLHGRYVAQKKPAMIINEEYQHILWDQSLRGGSEMSELPPLKFEDLWTPIRPELVRNFPRETWHAKVGSIDIKMPRTKHYPPDAASWKDSFWSVGVIIDDRILFTSDTRFDQDLLESFDGIFDFEVIFHDCQLFTGGVHTSLDEICTLPVHLRERIILMHYGDEWQDYQDQARDAGIHSWAKQGHAYTFPPEARACKASQP